MIEVSSRPDFIIIGGGSAGCVLAGRLTEDARISVLLIEAGDDVKPGETPPGISSSYPMALFHGTRWLWPDLMVYRNRDDPTSLSVPVFYEQGRVLGGGSSVNIQAANRGIPADYDEWQQLGAAGWSWSDVLPYFNKLETDQDYTGSLHGTSGPVSIRRVPRPAWGPLARVTGDALAKIGFEELQDQNSDFRDGFFGPAISNDGMRVSASRAYLTDAVRSRKNLTILTNAMVLRIIFSGGRATGVSYDRGRGPEYAAARNVILSAGAIHSPAILMSSGIGPGTLLSSLDIPVVNDLPVGRALFDHPGIVVGTYLPRSLRLDRTHDRHSHVCMRFSSSEDSKADLYLAVGNKISWNAIGYRIGAFFLWLNKPYSRGTVTIRREGTGFAPVADFKYFDDARDIERLSTGIKTVMDLADRIPGLSGDDLFPIRQTKLSRRMNRVGRFGGGLAMAAAAALDVGFLRKALLQRTVSYKQPLRTLIADSGLTQSYLKEFAFGYWHPSGTCKMGGTASSDAVVDTEGRVRGMENLYVIDASIMPAIPRANLNIPTLMIAEKLSDALKKRC